MTNTITFTSNGSAWWFNPISSALTALPNGPGTIVSLWQAASTGSPLNGDIGGLTDGSGSSTIANWYHTITAHATGFLGGGNLADDDGTVGPGLPTSDPTYVNGDWWILVVTWPGTTAVERFSYVDLSVGTWSHVNTSQVNGGIRAGPSTTVGQWNVGYSGDFPIVSNTVALQAAWPGVQFSDAQAEALLVNSKTSDWWNSAAGNPTLLIECTSTTPVDIGLHPSTFKQLAGTATLTGGVPPGWQFDGHGSVVTPPPPFVPHRMPMGV